MRADVSSANLAPLLTIRYLGSEKFSRVPELSKGSGEQSKAPMICTLRPVITRFVSLRLPTSIQPDAQRGRLGYRMLSVLPCCQKMSMKGRSIGRIMR